MCGPGDASWSKSEIVGGPSRALLQAVDQLASIANRIRGVPLGQELADLAETLQDEIAAMNGKGGGNNAQTIGELTATLANEREEREELRQSFAMHMVESAKREEALQAECTKLRIETPAKFQEQLSVALKEEAEIARAARKQLVKEVDTLRADLAAERSTVQALKAEVSAFRALRTDAPRPTTVPQDSVNETDGSLNGSMANEGESPRDARVPPSLVSQTSGRHQLTGSCHRERNFVSRDFAVKA